ncbi:hypothetical protein BsWGS_27674 [Bradybaena similaris]
MTTNAEKEMTTHADTEMATDADTEMTINAGTEMATNADTEMTTNAGTEMATNAGTESLPHASPSESSQLKTFQDFQLSCNKVNKQFEFCRQAELKGHTQIAIHSYSEVLQMIEQLLLVACDELLGTTPSELSHAKEIQHKIRLLKEDVHRRLLLIKSEASHSKDEPDPLIVSPKVSLESNKSPDSYFLGFDEPSHDSFTDATEVFIIPDTVLMFNISAGGTVTATSKQQTLHVVKFDHGFKKLSNGAFIPPAFLQVGDWLYPLMPGLSPALITKYRTYIFPDVLSEEEGAAVAIVLPLSLPRIERMKFEVILDHFTVLDNKHIQKEYLQAFSHLNAVPLATSGNTLHIASIISFLITVVASLTAWIITTGALVIIWLLQLAFRTIRSHVKPVEEPKKVDPSIRQGVSYIKTATNATVKVKQYVVDKLGESTMALAFTMAPVLKDQGVKVLPEFLMPSNNEFVRGSVQITNTYLKGLTKVYKSVDYASMSVMNKLTRESVDMIHYRFGEDIGTFASETLSTAECMVRTAQSAKNMNLMRFAIRAGNPTGMAALDKHVDNLSGSTDSKQMLTPAVFMKANATLHNSTQMYVQILERIGRSKMGLHKKSHYSDEEKYVNFRRSSVDGVLKTRMGKPAPFSQMQSKNKFQGRRFSLPTSSVIFESDVKSIFTKRASSSHGLLSTVLSVNETASRASNVFSAKHKPLKLHAEEEIASTKLLPSDTQTKVTRRKGSLYKN